MPVHVEEMGEVALVTDGGDRRGSFFYFDGFEFVFWESNRGEGEMRRENGGEWVPRVGLTKRSDHFTGMGPTKK